MLTPLGDPPLFLGYLQGVPFAWTLRLWPHWLTMTAGAARWLLLRLDSRAVRARDAGRAPARRARIEPLRDARRAQRVWLAGVVARRGVPARARGASSPSWPWPRGSLWRTPRRPPRRTASPRGPIVEVAVLFLGIFLTMVPALELLRLRGGRARRARALAVLLGHRRAVVVPRQRADLPRPSSRSAQGLAPARRVVGRAGT